MAAKAEPRFKTVAENRKARFHYEIGEKFEAGIAPTGSEVKSLRSGKAAIAESDADARGGEIWLLNSNITEYLQAGRFNHAPKRPRKLLLHKRQINKLIGAVERDGMTLVPLKLRRSRSRCPPTALFGNFWIAASARHRTNRVWPVATAGRRSA